MYLIFQLVMDFKKTTTKMPITENDFFFFLFSNGGVRPSCDGACWRLRVSVSVDGWLAGYSEIYSTCYHLLRRRFSGRKTCCQR